ncbi:MAG: TetR/AcrR family transcriptional regulator C-terminal domain-containing protein, partial [Bacteroidota bacterium]|nr:TetR/AcrR family transcriptional regulator C-terminal domain-containing protein [Bacteroidota bacterium]
NILNQFDEMADMLAKKMINEKIDSIKKITLLFENMFDSFVETPPFVSVIFSEEIFKNENVLKTKIIEIQNINQNTLEKIIAEGQKNNEIRNDINKKSLSYVIMGSLRLIVKKWDLNNYNFDLKAEGKILLNALKKMLVNN